MRTLFHDTELFTSGTRGRRDFDLPDADIMLIDGFFTKQESDGYYYQQQPKTLLTGKWNMIKGEMFTDGKLTFSEDLKKPGCEYDFLDLKSNGKKDETYHNEEDCTPENDAGTWSFVESSKQLTVVDDEDGYTVLYQVVSLTSTELKLRLLVEDGGAVPANIEVYAYLKK